MQELSKNAIWERVKSLPIEDRYATPEIEKSVLTNITELIRNPKKDAMISLFLSDKKCEISAFSDFEYFATVAAMHPRWIGTREGETSEEEFFLLYGKSFDLELLQSDEFVRKFWQKGNERLLKLGGNYHNFLSDIGVEKLYQRKEPFPSMGRVEKYNESSETLLLLCDLRGMEFVRPDPYHASLAENAYCRGEPLTKEEQAMLVSQAIYCLCTADYHRKIEMRLRADGDGKAAFDLIAYLKKLGVCGRIWIADDGHMTIDTMMALVEQSDAAWTVRLEIVLGDRDSRENGFARLRALSAVYPMSLWRFGGVPEASLLFAAGHMHMRRMICDLLARMVRSEEEGVALAKQIFGPEEI